MPRLFTGVAVPSQVEGELELMSCGIRGARWEPREKLHLTIAFIGEVDGGTARDVQLALDELRHPAFTCQLAGCGVFPPRGPARILWVGVDDRQPLAALHDAVSGALSRVGVETERRRYHAHVTLARLDRPNPAQLAEWIGAHNLYRSQPFEVDALRLYSSILAPAGSKYRVEAVFHFAASV